MAEEKKINPRHSVSIDRREKINITGVLDVITFDEENIVAETEMGTLVIHGTGMHINKLNLDNGEMDTEGEIVSLTYEQERAYTKNKSSFLSKLFR